MVTDPLPPHGAAVTVAVTGTGTWQQELRGRRCFSFNLSHTVYGEGGETLLKMDGLSERFLFSSLYYTSLCHQGNLSLVPSGESVTWAIPLPVTHGRAGRGGGSWVCRLSCCRLRAALGLGLLSPLICLGWGWFFFLGAGGFCLFSFVWFFIPGRETR